ncbi:MAG: type I phosphomannose isomerase catalytic subunit [Acidimicrobiia bacterium]
MQLQPFKLDPVLVERPWGGRRLASYGRALAEGVWIGESWEVADLPDEVAPTVDDPRSRVATGPHAGAALSDLIAKGDDLLGPVPPTTDGRFPLLVKLLDAREDLSVQVHPHAEYVKAHPEARLKTESWYVMDAEPGAKLYLDVIDGVDAAAVADSLGSQAVVPLLEGRPAVPGSFHHVPAGLIHALGAGVMVAEVQTPSDTTFRIYDWAVEYGRSPRQLHPVESIESIRLHPSSAFDVAPATSRGVRLLCANDHYWIREHRTEGRIHMGGAPGPRVLLVMTGSLGLGDLALEAGGTAIVPACALPAEASATGVVLEVGLPV